jgi:hypothetical protein
MAEPPIPRKGNSLTFHLCQLEFHEKGVGLQQNHQLPILIQIEATLKRNSVTCSFKIYINTHVCEPLGTLVSYFTKTVKAICCYICLSVLLLETSK